MVQILLRSDKYEASYEWICDSFEAKDNGSQCPCRSVLNMHQDLKIVVPLDSA